VVCVGSLPAQLEVASRQSTRERPDGSRPDRPPRDQIAACPKEVWRVVRRRDLAGRTGHDVFLQNWSISAEEKFDFRTGSPSMLMAALREAPPLIKEPTGINRP
jgi:hypothetical protein